MNVNLNNSDGTEPDKFCHTCRVQAVHHLGQLDAGHGKKLLDMGGETPEVYWKKVQSSFEHIQLCDSCIHWAESLYRESFLNPVASMVEKLQTIARSNINARHKHPKKTEHQLKERDMRRNKYCCSSMYRAVEAENGYLGLKARYVQVRDERLWSLTWKEHENGVIDAVYCPWCGQKMPQGLYVE